MAKFRHHIFICENERAPDNPKGCCFSKGGADVREAIKAEIERRNWRKIVRANSAGCLDQCSRGVAMVIYPENIWYGGVKKEDVVEILDSLQKGVVVERLRITDDQLTGKALSGSLP